MRKSMGNWTKYLLALVVVIFFLSSISSLLYMSNRYNVISCNGKKLRLNEFVEAVNQEIKLMLNQNINDGTILQEKIDFINSPIFLPYATMRIRNDLLLELETENLQLQKPHQLVLQDIYTDTDFQVEGTFNFDKFENILKRLKLTEYEFLTHRSKTNAREFVEEIFYRLLVPAHTSEELLIEMTNTYRDLEIFSLEEDKLDSNKSSPSLEEQKSYYQHHLNQYMIPESRKFSYIKLNRHQKTLLQQARTLLRHKEKTSIFTLAKLLQLTVSESSYINKNNPTTNEIGLEQRGFSFQPQHIYEHPMGDDIYFVTLTDIHQDHLQKFEEVATVVVADLQREKTREFRQALLKKQITAYLGKEINQQTLEKHDYQIRIQKNMSTKALRNKYGIAIATKIEELQEGELSEVFFHDNQLQIIHLKKIGLMYTQQQDYLPATVITETLMKQRQEEIRSKYLDQLAHKYNTRIRYDLLKLIRAQKH